MSYYLSPIQHISAISFPAAPEGILTLPASDDAPDGWGLPVTVDNAPLGTPGGTYPRAVLSWDTGTAAWTLKRLQNREAGNIDWKSSDADIPVLSWIGPQSRYFTWGVTVGGSAAEAALTWPRSTALYARGRQVATAPGGIVGACIRTEGSGWRIIVLCHESATQVSGHYCNLSDLTLAGPITWTGMGTLTLTGTEWATPFFANASGTAAAGLRVTVTDLPGGLGKDRSIATLDLSGDTLSVGYTANYTLSGVSVPDTTVVDERTGLETLLECVDGSGVCWKVDHQVHHIIKENAHTLIYGPYTIAVDYSGDTLVRFDIDVDIRTGFSTTERTCDEYLTYYANPCGSAWNLNGRSSTVIIHCASGDWSVTGTNTLVRTSYSEYVDISTAGLGGTIQIRDHRHASVDTYTGTGSDYNPLFCSFYTAPAPVSSTIDVEQDTPIHHLDARHAILVATDITTNYPGATTQDRAANVHADGTDQCSLAETGETLQTRPMGIVLTEPLAALGAASERNGKSLISIRLDYTAATWFNHLSDSDPVTLTEITGDNPRFIPASVI